MLKGNYSIFLNTKFYRKNNDLLSGVKMFMPCKKKKLTFTNCFLCICYVMCPTESASSYLLLRLCAVAKKSAWRNL